MREPYPSETQDRFMVRLPDGMRDKIKAAAQAAKRNMNGEIIARLEASFQADDQPVSGRTVRSGASLAVTGALPEPDLEARLRSLEITVMAMIANLSEIADKLGSSADTAQT